VTADVISKARWAEHACMWRFCFAPKKGGCLNHPIAWGAGQESAFILIRAQQGRDLAQRRREAP
jgi:hypothetical protein